MKRETRPLGMAPALMAMLAAAVLLGLGVKAHANHEEHVRIVVDALRRGTLGPNEWIQGNLQRRHLLGGFPGRTDLDGLRRCSGFTMRLAAPSADDVLVAAGVALAAGRPSIYIVDSRKDLPWFLREADLAYPGQVVIVEGADPLGSLRAHPPDLRSGLSARPSREPEVDTFIGCLMSGLTEAQYAEGRRHLQAIDDALRGRLRSPNNFCEGIRVASSRSFDAPREALVRDLAAVRNSARCVFYAYDRQPRPSGMWLEAGIALGLGKPCTFLVPDLQVLPPALRSQAGLPNVHVVVYPTHAQLLEQLARDPETLLGR